MTILLADDNVDAGWVLSRLLQQRGHRTVLATGGEEALRLAETERPDGAILDVGMPDVDGVEVARRIRARPWGRRLWLVALTGWGGVADRRHLLQSGFDEHLVKPLDEMALGALLRGLSLAYRQTG